MTNPTIPLPEPVIAREDTAVNSGEYYTADQMHQYAAAVSAAKDARIKVLEDALKRYMEVYENVPDAIGRDGEWYQTEDAKLCDRTARAALGDKTP